MGSLCSRTVEENVAHKSGQDEACTGANDHRVLVEKMSMKERLEARDKLEQQRKEQELMKIHESSVADNSYVDGRECGTPISEVVILPFHDYSTLNREGKLEGGVGEYQDNTEEPLPSPPAIPSDRSTVVLPVTEEQVEKDEENKEGSVFLPFEERKTFDSPSPASPRDLSEGVTVLLDTPARVIGSEAVVREVSIEQPSPSWTLPEGVVIALAPPPPVTTPEEDHTISHTEEGAVEAEEAADKKPSISEAAPRSLPPSLTVLPGTVVKLDFDAPSPEMALIFHEKTTPGSSFAVTPDGEMGENRFAAVTGESLKTGSSATGETVEEEAAPEVVESEPEEEVQPSPSSVSPPQERREDIPTSYQDPREGLAETGNEGEERKTKESVKEDELVKNSSASSHNRSALEGEQKKEDAELVPPQEIDKDHIPLEREPQSQEEERSSGGDHSFRRSSDTKSEEVEDEKEGIEHGIAEVGLPVREEEMSYSSEDPEHAIPRLHPEPPDEDELPFSQPLNSTELDEAAELQREDVEGKSREEDVVAVASSTIPDQDSYMWASHPASFEQVSHSNRDELPTESGKDEEQGAGMYTKEKKGLDNEMPVKDDSKEGEGLFSSSSESKEKNSRSDAPFSGRGLAPPPAPVDSSDEDEKNMGGHFSSRKEPSEENRIEHDGLAKEFLHNKSPHQENVFGLPQESLPLRRPPPPTPPFSSEDEEVAT